MKKFFKAFMEIVKTMCCIVLVLAVIIGSFAMILVYDYDTNYKKIHSDFIHEMSYNCYGKYAMQNEVDKATGLNGFGEQLVPKNYEEYEDVEVFANTLQSILNSIG